MRITYGPLSKHDSLVARIHPLIRIYFRDDFTVPLGGGWVSDDFNNKKVCFVWQKR